MLRATRSWWRATATSTNALVARRVVGERTAAAAAAALLQGQRATSIVRGLKTEAASGLQEGDSATTWDAVVVGGGHNGLVCAAYLARAGQKVLVLERRHLLGGAAVTEELYPGFKFSRASYLFSLFRPTIVEELQLKRHGLKFYHRHPSSFTPLHEGRYLMLGSDSKWNREEIGKFSLRDAALYEEYEEWLQRLVRVIDPLLDAPPLEIQSPRNRGEWLSQLATLGKFGKELLRLGKDLPAFYELLTAPAYKMLNRWFESEPLKATLATDAVIGAMTSPNTPGSGYVLFHHVMGQVDGRAGAWAYVEGGMGAVSEAIARAAKEAGAQLRCSTPVQEILVDDGEAKGVRLQDGSVVRAKRVVSNATTHMTFLRMLDSKHHLPSSYRRHIEHLDYTSPVCKINIALDSLPNFKCLPTIDGKSGPQHNGTIHFNSETCEQIEAAYRDCAVNGIPSRAPVIEMTIPSVHDPTLAPPGKHVASLFCQYAPYNLAGGWTKGAREDFAKTVFGSIEEYCPGFSKSVLYADILAPPDLERVFGLTGGNIFHHSMGLDQLYFLRPVQGWARHRTPIKGLYLCGSGTHPGGGVMGAPGRHAAQVIAHDAGK